MVQHAAISFQNEQVEVKPTKMSPLNTLFCPICDKTLFEVSGHQVKVKCRHCKFWIVFTFINGEWQSKSYNREPNM